MNRFVVLVVCALGGCLLLAGPAHAEDGPPLHVVTRVMEPFVIKKDGGYDGYSEALLKLVAQELNRPISAQDEVKSIPELINRVSTPGSPYDLGIANISITKDRHRQVDFSLPIYSSGLQILIKKKTTASNSPMDNLVSGLISSGVIRIAVLLLVVMLFVAHVIYFAERRHKKSFLHGEPYFSGVREAYWWALTAFIGQEETHPSSWLSRPMATIWALFGIICLAVFTATITTSLTVQQIQAVNGLEDLRGKRVVTVQGSTSESYLADRGFNPKTVSVIQQAYAELDQNKVDAVIFDAPTLQYYASHQGKDKAIVVGGVFNHEDYGIAFPKGSPLRHDVDEALLKLAESGQLDQLSVTYVGQLGDF